MNRVEISEKRYCSSVMPYRSPVHTIKSNILTGVKVFVADMGDTGQHHL